MQVLHELVAVTWEFYFKMSLVVLVILGRRNKALITKSEDLPIVVLEDHE